MAGEGFSDDFWTYQAEHGEKWADWQHEVMDIIRNSSNFCHLRIRDYGGLPPSWQGAKYRPALDLNCLKMGDKYGDRVRRFLSS